MELLDPKVDFVFKRIFGSEHNKDVLLAFLNRIFADVGGEALEEIVLMNPYTDKDDPTDKQSIFDIFAKTLDGRLIDIEMQLFNKYDIEKRSLYYWSKRYSSQLEEGQRYKKLNKCITINLLNYRLLPGRAYHHVFHLKEDQTGLPLTDDLEVHMLELTKLDESAGREGLAAWLLFLREGDNEQWEALDMDEPELLKAFETLRYLSQDSEARRLYEARQKYLHDEASLLEGVQDEIREAKEKALEEGLAVGIEQGIKMGIEQGIEQGTKRGIEQGIKQGIERGMEQGEQAAAKRMAAKMLDKGLEAEEVAEITGLSAAEIAQLRR